MRIWILLFFSIFHLPLAADPSPVASESIPVSPEEEWQQLCTHHQVKAWYMDALENTSILKTGTNITELPMLNLFEITEADGRFNRMASPVRHNIEKEILLDVERTLGKEPPETTVRLLSLGCTGHLQDWYIVGQLLRQGKTHIDLTIVDTNLFNDSVAGFQKFAKALEAEGITLTLSFHDTLDAYPKGQKTRFHSAYAIAYHALASCDKGIWKGISTARKLLSDNAHLFVSYLEETLTFDANGKIQVLETSPENQLLRETIVAAQRRNPRSKDCSIRIQVSTTTPSFILAPLLYATSDLLQAGYRDVMIYTLSPGLDWLGESDLSALFSDLSEKSGTARLHWKRRFLIESIREDRRDMVICYLKKMDLPNAINSMNRFTVILGKLVPPDGHWIVFSDQLGLWDVDGLGRKKILLLPKGNEDTAKKLMEKIFAPGLHWSD